MRSGLDQTCDCGADGQTMQYVNESSSVRGSRLRYTSWSPSIVLFLHVITKSKGKARFEEIRTNKPVVRPFPPFQACRTPVRNI